MGVDKIKIQEAANKAGFKESFYKGREAMLFELIFEYIKESAEAGARAGRKVAEMLVAEDPEAWREEYRKKQAAGVKYEVSSEYDSKVWMDQGPYQFTLGKDRYREAPQQLPHAAERALWKAQREAGTNEVWQFESPCGRYVDDVPVDIEPDWMPHTKYYPKPKSKPAKLVAKIIRNKPVTLAEYEAQIQDWSFTGTPEEYRAECEKYGYVVVSEIKEIKTVKYYFAFVRDFLGVHICHDYVEKYESAKEYGCVLNQLGKRIIGDIEEREIEA